MGLGIDGIEAYHPAHGPAVVQAALTIAEQHDLIVTGGSDHHGVYSDYDATLGCADLTRHTSVPYWTELTTEGMGAIVHPAPALKVLALLSASNPDPSPPRTG